MTTTRTTIKNHIAAGLDITQPVTWINHLNQPVPATITKSGRFYMVRDNAGEILQNGGAGAQFAFSY